MTAFGRLAAWQSTYFFALEHCGSTLAPIRPATGTGLSLKVVLLKGLAFGHLCCFSENCFFLAATRTEFGGFVHLTTVTKQKLETEDGVFGDLPVLCSSPNLRPGVGFEADRLGGN